MNGAHHVDLTLAVATALGIKDARTISLYADLPDRVNDICVRGVGTHIFGRTLCSLTHFCIPTGGKTHRGWGWKLDDSLPYIDLPNREVAIEGQTWEDVGCFESVAEHPLARILDVRGYTKYADEITYPTAAIMADWVAVAHQTSKGAVQRAVVAGCLAHFVQDCCVKHHVQGWLLNGHSSYEGDLEEWWHRNRRGSAVRRMLIAAARTKMGLSPRTACEQTCHLTRTYCNGQYPNEERRVHRYAIKATTRVLRWWQENVR